MKDMLKDQVAIVTGGHPEWGKPASYMRKKEQRSLSLILTPRKPRKSSMRLLLTGALPVSIIPWMSPTVLGRVCCRKDCRGVRRIDILARSQERP